MTNSDFHFQKQQFMQGLWPQKVIDLSCIMHIGEDVYSIEGTEIQADNVFTNAFDRIIGIGSQQRKMVKGASGETGLTNYRCGFEHAKA